MGSTTTEKFASGNALDSWKAAHAALASAIGAYVGACSYLESFCELASEGQPVLEEICDTLDEKIPVLISYEETLCLARTGLQRRRNTSSKLSSVRWLPLEILAIIFAVTVDQGRIARIVSHPKPLMADPANVLASVCSHWRRVAIGIPELWSYIDLSRRGGLNHASLWLERTRNGPIDIRTGSETSPADWHQRPSALLSSITRARSLLLRGDPDAMEMWLSEWYRHGVPGTTTTLALYPTLEEGDPSSFPGPSIQSQSHLDELLRHIRVLYLCGLAVTWSQVTFQDLTVLCLAELEQDVPQRCLTIDILRTMLLSSPRLRCLQIARTTLPSMGSRPEPEKIPSIHLHHLEMLELSDLLGDDVVQILSIIAPGSRNLALALRGTNDYWGVEAVIEDAIYSFIQRSNITAFFCGPNTVTSLSPNMVRALPNIEVLYLVAKTIAAEFSDSVAPENSGEPSVRTRWPRLHTFEAADCEFEDIIDFKRLLSECPIRELRINHGCDTAVYMGDQRDHGSLEFADWAGPGVVFSDKCREWRFGYMPFQ